MRVKESEVKNFRIIKEMSASIPDDKKVVLVKGRNGSGKSSYLKALNYLLFNVKQDEASFKDFIRKGAKECVLSATFEYQGKELELSAVVGKTNSRKLIYEDALYENSQAIEKLQTILPGYSLGIQASTSFQGMTDLISATPAERRTMLESIYNLDYSDKVDALKKTVKEAEARIVKVDQELYFLENSKKPLQRFAQISNMTPEEKEQAQKRIAELRTLIASIESTKKMISIIEKAKKDYDDFVVPAKPENIACVRPHNCFTTGDRYSKLNRKLSDLKADVLSAQSELKVLKESIESFGNGLCPTCGQEFVGWEQKIKDINTQIDEKNLELEDAVKVYDAVKEECASLELLYVEQRDKVRSFKRLVTQYKTAIDNHKKGVAKKAELYEKYLELQANSSITHETSQSDGSEYLSEISSLENRIKEYDEQVMKKAMIEKANEEAKKQNALAESKLKDLAKEKEELQNTIYVNSEAQKILGRDFPSWVLLKETKNVEAEMNKFLDDTYDGRYHVTIDIAKTGIGILYNDGSDVSLASGSEKDLMNLAFKMALSRLSGMKILFLDEVDKFCDITVASKLFDTVLEQVKRGRIEQVFIVTHSVDMQNKLELCEEVAVLEM